MNLIEEEYKVSWEHRRKTVYSTNVQLKSSSICYLKVCMCQESEHGLAVCLWLKISEEIVVMLLAGAVVLSEDPISVEWRGHLFLFLLMWLWASISPSPLGTFHRSVPPHDMAADSLQTEQLKRDHKRLPKVKATVYNLLSEVTALHFCCFLFIRNQSISLAPIQGEIITQGCDYQEVWIIGCHLSSYLLHAGSGSMGAFHMVSPVLCI